MRIRVRPFVTLLHFSSLLAAQLSRLHVPVWSYLIVNRVLSREFETFQVRSSRTLFPASNLTVSKNPVSSIENNFILIRWSGLKALGARPTKAWIIRLVIFRSSRGKNSTKAESSWFHQTKTPLSFGNYYFQVARRFQPDSRFHALN